MERAVLKKLTSLCVICGLVGLALLGTTAIRDEKREWKTYQEDYRALLLKKVDRKANPVLHERVSGAKPKIRQVVLEGVNVVDRCTTCHLGIDDPLFVDAAQPLATHPRPELLQRHPVEKFGCTLCHGGQGAATTYEGAAHRSIPHWPEPMVDKRFMESRCGHCHRDFEAIAADRLVRGRRLFEEMYCSGCHKVDPDDGSMAPALTAFADKDAGLFDFTHIEGEHSKQNWVMEHFIDPQRVTPGSPMRTYAMNQEQLEALTSYVLSLSEKVYPVDYYTPEELTLLR